MPFQLPFGVQVLNPVPVDYYSGPYTASNIQDAINIASASIPSPVRFQSMEVRLIIAGVSKKYWYRDNITDLVEFSSIGSGNSDVFYNLGGTVSATNSTSSIYRIGNIGIGTASPSTKLHIFATQSGAFRLVDGTQGPGYLLASDINGVATWTASTYAPDSNVVHKTGNENISGVKTFQNIGVLTNVVVQNYNTNTASSALLVQIGNPGMGIKSENESSGIGIYSNSTSTGLNYVGANSGVTTFSVNKIGGVYASSSVSIGTSGASASLHIKGISSVSGNSLLVENSSNTQLLKVLNNGQIILGDNNFAVLGPGGVQGVFIIGQGNGYSGPNTSNPNLLTFIVGSTDPTFVSGIQGASLNHGNVRSGIYFTNNASDIVFRTGPTTSPVPERMRINVSGNVGIGTASPSTTLHIFATQSGAFRLQDGTQSYPGYVLTSDANGVGTWQGNTQITLSSATATALATWNNATIMCNFSATCLITIPDTGLPPNFSFRFIIISGNSSSAITFTYSSPVSILPNTLLTFAQYESGVIDRLGATGQNYYITY